MEAIDNSVGMGAYDHFIAMPTLLNRYLKSSNAMKSNIWLNFFRDFNEYKKV